MRAILRSVLVVAVVGAMNLPRRFGGQSNNGPRRALAGAAGAALLAKPLSAVAFGREAALADKLGAVPAFFVANSRGSPYLLNKEAEGAQECVIFLEPRDAEALLSEMTQASPQLSDARVFCVGLDKALGMLKRKPQPSGNVARNGKELKLSDIIVGDEAQEELAAEVVLLEEGSAGYQVLLNKYAEVRD